MVNLRPRRARPKVADVPEDNDTDAILNLAGTHSPSESYIPQDDEMASGIEESENDSASSDSPKLSGRAKKRAAKKMPLKRLPATSSKPTAALPSLEHRHRVPPLYLRPSSGYRLMNSPSPLRPSRIVATHNVHDDRRVLERLTRSLGRNVGSGPLWQLMDDRTWYKEYGASDEVESLQIKPVVYSQISNVQWTEVDSMTAKPHVPRQTGDSESSGDCPVLTCSFGPFESQRRIEMKMYDFSPMSDFFPQSESFVFFAGSPVWSMDWCPVPLSSSGQSYKQHLAVAPLPSSDYSVSIGRRISRPSPSCLQLWTMTKTGGENAPSICCSIVLCLHSGSALHIRWCPLPSHVTNNITGAKRVGILAGTFEDGSASIFSVPDPEEFSDDVIPHYKVQSMSPLARIELAHTTCITLEWANADIIAVGCMNGCIAIYFVRDAILKESDEALVLLHYISAHQSAIRSLSWVKVPPVNVNGKFNERSDPTVIISGGYDGVLVVTELRDETSYPINRVQDVLNTVEFSSYASGVLCADSDNSIKTFVLSPQIFGRGHLVMESTGPIMSLGLSDYHPHLAAGSADGTCQTTNLYKNTRRGGSVPFLVYKIFQLDYNRESKEYRMMERFFPHELYDRNAVSNATRSKSKAEVPSPPATTGAWPPEISVTCTLWNNGPEMSQSALLASATASGLCRIDWLLGRFMCDNVPYNSVEAIRGEVPGVDEGSSDEL